MTEALELTCACQECGVSISNTGNHHCDTCLSAMIDEIKFTTFDPENADDRRIVNMFLPANEQI